MGCVNLVNREYCFLNEQLSAEEFERKAKQLRPLIRDRVEDLQNQLAQLAKQSIRRATYILKSEDCVGDHIRNSRNCY